MLRYNIIKTSTSSSAPVDSESHRSSYKKMDQEVTDNGCLCKDKISHLEEQMKKLTEQVSTLESSLKDVLRNEEELKENMARLENSVDTALKTVLPRLELLLHQYEGRSAVPTGCEKEALAAADRRPSIDESLAQDASQNCRTSEQQPSEDPISRRRPMSLENQHPSTVSRETSMEERLADMDDLLSEDVPLLSLDPPAYEDVVPSAPLWDDLLPLACGLPRGRMAGERVSRREGDRAQSPLELAAAKGYTSTVETLLRCGAAGDCPQLDRALRASGGPVATHMLLDAGADPRSHDAQGRTALHYAAQKGLSACVSTLIDFGALVEDKDQWGRTPLHLAVQSNHEETAKVLLAAGASPLTMNNEGQRPKDLAQSVKMQNILRR